MIKHTAIPEIILLQITPLRRAWFIAFMAFALSGCANKAHLVNVQPLDKSAATPYNKVLVVGLFKSFETRSLLERAIVQDIGRGTPGAVAATSFMKTTTPLNYESIMAVVKESGADAVLVTQLIDKSSSKTIVKDRNPQTSYKVSPANTYPTYYWNVWEVQIKEYMEPQYLETKLSLLLMTELHQVDNQQLVWAVESKAKIVKDLSRPDYYPFLTSDSAKIVERMRSEGMIQKTAATP
jgi:hypothetical protein